MEHIMQGRQLIEIPVQKHTAVHGIRQSLREDTPECVLGMHLIASRGVLE